MITQKGEIFYVVVKYKDISGKWKKKWYKVSTSKREAERFERKVLTARDAGEQIFDRKTAPTMKQFLNQWLDASIKPPARSLGTYENYQYCIGHINAYIGKVRLDSLSPLQITKMYRKLSQNGLSASTVRMIHRVLRAALNKAVRWEYLMKNPVLSADVPSKTPSPSKALDKIQALAFLGQSETMGLSANLIAALEMLCGLRDAEVTGLRREDYDKENSRLYIRHNLSLRSLDGIDPKLYEFVTPCGSKYLVLDKAKTESSCNFIILPPYVKGIIDKIILRNDVHRMKYGPAYKDNHFILCDDFGAPRSIGYVYDNVQRIVDRYNETHKEKLPHIRAHDLRHTAATLLLEENIDIKYVSRQLRHSSTVITQNLYQHVTDRMASITADAMENLVNPPPKEDDKAANSSTPVSTPNA